MERGLMMEEVVQPCKEGRGYLGIQVAGGEDEKAAARLPMRGQSPTEPPASNTAYLGSIEGN